MCYDGHIALDFFIAWESPELIIVENLEKAVALYCVCSLHSEAIYNWGVVGKTTDDKKFPSTPVIYKAGLYRCMIRSKFDSHELRGTVLTVRVDMGMLLMVQNWIHFFPCFVGGDVFVLYTRFWHQ